MATVHTGDSLQFLSSAAGGGASAVLWIASEGQIAPSGVFTAPTPTIAPPTDSIKPITVTATRASDRTQIATAQIYLHAKKLVMDQSVVDAAAMSVGAKVEFHALGPGGVESGLQWFLSGPGSLDGTTGVYTIRDKSAAYAIVTAVDPAGGRQAAAVIRLASGRGGDDTPLLLLVVIMGAFGALLGAMRSFVNYVGTRTFIPSWSFYYFSGPCLAPA